MKNYPYPKEFVIDTDARKYWVGTRKQPFPLVGEKIKHFGIFRTDGYRDDLRMFRLALVIDILLGLAINYGALRFGLGFFLISIASLIVVIVFEILLANHLMRNNHKAHIADSSILLELHEPNPDSSKIEYYKSVKREGAALNYTIIAFLYVLAIFKGFIFFLVVRTSIHLKIVAFALFGIVAYIHHKHSGYVRKEYLFRDRLKKDKKAWENPATKEKYNVPRGGDEKKQIPTLVYMPIPDGIKLDDSYNVTSEQGTLTLRKYTNENTKMEMLLMEHFPIILDSEVLSLINNMPERDRDGNNIGALKESVALKCIEIQLSTTQIGLK